MSDAHDDLHDMSDADDDLHDMYTEHVIFSFKSK
jgi:hypothetical protein